MQLADLGADVIKIEDPSVGGDSARAVPPYLNDDRPHDSLYFQSFNRNKRSLTLNLRSTEGQRVLHRLTERADVVFNNLRGDLPERLGLTYGHLASANPRVVCVSCSGYGTRGTHAGEPGYDYLFQALTGMMSITGEPSEPPARTGVSIIDFTAGLTAMVGLLSGLIAARRDGVGRDVDVSLLGTGLSLMNYIALWTLNRGYRPEKISRSQHPSLVPVGVFPTLDGNILVMCMKQKFYDRLCDEIGHPELASDPLFHDPQARLRNRDLLNGRLDEILSTRSTDDWMSRLRAKLPCAPVNDVAGALADPLITQTGMIWSVAHPDFGDIRQIGSAIDMTAGRRTVQRRGPFLGEDTEAVLGEAGIGSAELARLRAKGVV
jgi:crotonobetainyl-CoA:carnitine CoA-transferase CaiB-like acyl-CoA transferase